LCLLDKNPEREEEAKIEFQVLQKAYEVLSNQQERAWYDEHWRTILREGIILQLAEWLQLSKYECNEK